MVARTNQIFLFEINNYPGKSLSEDPNTSPKQPPLAALTVASSNPSITYGMLP